MTKFSKIEYLTEFTKDLKKLSKKFPSLDGDLKTLISAQLIAFHKYKIDNHGIFHIEGLSISYPKIYKVKKFACKSLKGRGAQSGLRVVYAYFPDLDQVVFIEIYYKANQANENRERIKKQYHRS